MASKRNFKHESRYGENLSPCSTDDDNDEEYVVRVPGVGRFTSKPRNSYRNMNIIPKDFHLPVIEHLNDDTASYMERRPGERSDPEMDWQSARRDSRYRNTYASSGTQDMDQQRNVYVPDYSSTVHNLAYREIETKVDRVHRHSRINANESIDPSDPDSVYHEIRKANNASYSKKGNNIKPEKHEMIKSNCQRWEDLDEDFANKADKKTTRKQSEQQQPRPAETNRRGSKNGKSYAHTKHPTRYSASDQLEREDSAASNTIPKKVSAATPTKCDDRNYMPASTWRELVTERRNSSGGHKQVVTKGTPKKTRTGNLPAGGQSSTESTVRACRTTKDTTARNGSKNKTYFDRHQEKSSSSSSGVKNEQQKANVEHLDNVHGGDRLDAYERTMMELKMVGDGRLEDVDINVLGHRPPNECSYARAKYGDLADYDDVEDLDVNTSELNETYPQDRNDNINGPLGLKPCELSPRQVVNQGRPSKPSPGYLRTKPDKSYAEQRKKYAANHSTH